jgi:hypothetical protein
VRVPSTVSSVRIFILHVDAQLDLYKTFVNKNGSICMNISVSFDFHDISIVTR